MQDRQLPGGGRLGDIRTTTSLTHFRALGPFRAEVRAGRHVLSAVGCLSAPELTIALPALLLLAGTTIVVWSGLNLVPIRLLFRYGLTPVCEPTGKVIKVQDIEFAVIGRGCFRMGSTENGKPGTLPGRFCGPVGIEWGEPPVPSDEMPVHWVEFPAGFVLAKTEITNAQYERFDPRHERSEYSNGDADPVVSVSFDDARKYCEWLSEKSGRKVRLPTWGGCSTSPFRSPRPSA